MASLPSLCVALSLLVVTLTYTLPSGSDACVLEVANNESRDDLIAMLGDVNVQLVAYDVYVEGYSHDFWRRVGGSYWFQPWKWYRAKGTNPERLLLLYHYYFGLLQQYLTIGTRKMDLHLTVTPPECLIGTPRIELETLFRKFLYYDLRNETERPKAKFDDKDNTVRVCSMRVGDYDGWGRLVYHCCSRDEADEESCSDIVDDEWVWVLRISIFIVTVLLFLYFPKLIPKGYFIYYFKYYPPDGMCFNMLLTSNPEKYQKSPDSTVLHYKMWRRMRQFKAEFSKLQPEVVHKVKVECVNFICGMDRLLSETCSPVSALRSLFDTVIRCKVRHADPLEDCCNTSICGEICCTGCIPWHALLRALRTILVLGVLAVPAMPLMYAIAGEDLFYQELSELYNERGLLESTNIYPGPVFGKVIVGLLAFFYVLHMVLLVIDGCANQNLSRAYSTLLQVTRREARLQDRIRQSQSIVRKAAWPFKRFGILAFPIGVVCLVLLPIVLIVYLVFTSPVPKLIAHTVLLLLGKHTDRRHKSKAEMSKCRLLENVLFVFSLIVVFAVLTLGINFLVFLAIICMVQVLVDLSVVMKFLPIFVLLLVYVRDSFKVVNNTYASHHKVVLRHVINIEAEDLKREADKDWKDQENKVFKIVPTTAVDPKGAAGKDEEDYKKKKLFLMKNGAVRMRTRSLVLFLDKDDIPYISKKFMFDTTHMQCPGCPGPLPEAYLRAAGRFGRTLVFLLFLLLVVMAFADTYYISPTSQFFATIMTGAIPLFLRYLFLNPGSVTTVDTSTLRFQTQMDDKIEEFQQTWAVEDMIVNRFELPEDLDRHYDPHFTGLNNVNEEKQEEAPPPDEAPPRHPHKKRRKRHKSAPDSTSVPPPPSLNRQPLIQHPRDDAAESRGRRGELNYMMGGSDIEMMDGTDDVAGYHMYNNAAMEPQDPYLQPQHLQLPPPSSKPPKKKPKREPQPSENGLDHAGTELPVDDRGEGVSSNATPNNNNNVPKDKGGKKKAKKEKARIDLVIDISGEQGHLLRRQAALGKGHGGPGAGGSGPPQFHWNKRSRLVTENRSEHVV